MAQYYNHTTLSIPDRDAETLTLKRNGAAAQTFSEKSSGYFLVDATDFVPDDYYCQFADADGAIIATDKITVRQNLAYAPDDYDPRSRAEIVIEAIDAMLGDRATAQQRKIQLGDKSIEYSSLDELLKWRDFFKRKLAQEQGKPYGPRRQTFDMRGA